MATKMKLAPKIEWTILRYQFSSRWSSSSKDNCQVCWMRRSSFSWSSLLLLKILAAHVMVQLQEGQPRSQESTPLQKFSLKHSVSHSKPSLLKLHHLLPVIIIENVRSLGLTPTTKWWGKRRFNKICAKTMLCGKAMSQKLHLKPLTNGACKSPRFLSTNLKLLHTTRE